MNSHSVSLALGALATFAHAQTAPALQPSPSAPTVASVLAATTPADWRALDPENTIYMDVAGARPGRVIFELAPSFAPAHVANVKALAREGYFDGLSINRLQDNYVAQWGDASPQAQRRALKTAKQNVPAEFDRALAAAPGDLPFTRNPDGDLYAAEAGWSQGFASARDPRASRQWLTHCYGALASARSNEADSGGGTQLYVVIGHAPRHLDRNTTVFGRVIQGMEHLSSLPRGTGNLGFYEKAEERVPIASFKVAADLPAEKRVALEVLRTDTTAFEKLLQLRRARRDAWFHFPVDRLEVCNAPVPSRPAVAR
jgi:peptidylprolyl isomerase